MTPHADASGYDELHDAVDGESYRPPQYGHRKAWVVWCVIGNGAFFQLFFNRASFDVAFHQDWMDNTTFFGPMEHHHPTHMNFVGWRHGSTAVAALFTAILGLSPTVQQRSLFWFKASTWITFASGVLLLCTWLAVRVPAFGNICGVCLLFTLSRIAFGLGNGMAWCFGVAYLYGVTRQQVHRDQLFLIGALAMPMLLGEIIGFGVAYMGDLLCDWAWLMLTAAFTLSAPLLQHFCCIDHRVKKYGHLTPAASRTDPGAGENAPFS
ncbi:hypothetical protein AAVH_17208, partial [Aphelenchoides avenae]